MLTYSLEPTKNYPTDSLNNLASASAFSSVITKIENSHSLPSTTIIQPEKSKKNWGLIRFINRITKNEQISNQEYSYLLCSTVHPKTARKFEGKIKFNGTGDIISLRKKSITREDYNILIKNRIKPLNETPQIMENRIRTPGEAIIDIAGLIKKTSETLINKKELEKLIKCTWLDGSLSQQSLHNMVELVKIKLSEHPNIISDIDHIMETLEKDFFVTKRNDNYYGRLFETELSKYIVNNPCDNMIKVRDIVGGFILDDFLNISEVEQINLCHVLAESMYKDPPLWRYNISHADVFLLERTPKNFIEMMRFKGSHSVSLVLSTAVKYITFSPGTRTLKNRASQY